MLRKPGCESPLQFEAEEELALYLLNHKRDAIIQYEKMFDTKINIEIVWND